MESIIETKASTILQFFAGVRGDLRVVSESRADRMKNPGAWHDAAALRRAARRSRPAGEEIVGAECREQSRPLAEGEVFSLDIPFNGNPLIAINCAVHHQLLELPTSRLMARLALRCPISGLPVIGQHEKVIYFRPSTKYRSPRVRWKP